jgi:hypothetical protein
MIREHFSNRTSAPQPQLLITGVVWVIALICLFGGSQPRYGWAMVGMAALLTVYVGVRFWLYYAKPK